MRSSRLFARYSLCLTLAASALALSSEALANSGDPRVVGCSDGTREGFTSQAQYPLIASCGGAWDIPSAFHDAPACQRVSGNDSINPNGVGCNVEDLCGEGWHVCYGPDDFAIRTGGLGCADAVASNYPNNGTGTIHDSVSGIPGAFFMSRTSGYGTGHCDEVVNGLPLSFNDLFGCGTMGGQPQSNCAPFNRFSNNQCISFQTALDYAGSPASYFGYRPTEYAWTCNDGGDGTQESRFVQKWRGGDQGGVLCCKDSDASLPEICDRRDNNANGLIDEVDFDGDGLIDEKPGDYCVTPDNRDGEIACTSRGGWECLPSQPRACCLPSGACEDLNVYRCTLASGSISGASCATLTDMCVQPVHAEVSGRTWLDANRNGLFDADEQPLADVELYLRGATNHTTVSNADGVFRFSGLGLGSYTLGYEATQARLADNNLSSTLESPRTLPNGSWHNPSSVIILMAPGVTNASFGFVEACITDADNDGICDNIDPCVDADGDGFGIGDACAGPDCDDNYLYCNIDCSTDVISDGNNIPDCYETECTDEDGDGYGVGPGCFGNDCNDSLAACTFNCTDTDNDGEPDCIDDDDDNDGLPDALELLYGTDPRNPDSDGDGLSDGQEVNVHNTDPRNPDSDNDGLSDGQEVNVHNTDPRNPDSDGDGVLDGEQYGGDTGGGDGDTGGGDGDTGGGDGDTGGGDGDTGGGDTGGGDTGGGDTGGGDGDTGGGDTGGGDTGGGNGDTGGSGGSANTESGCAGSQVTPWASLLALVGLRRRRRS